MTDEVETIIVAISVALAVLIGITVIDSVGQTAIQAEGGTDGDGFTHVTEAALLEGNTFVQVRDDYAVGRNETVYDSLGNAIRLNGANDSYVDATAKIQPATDDSWTVHQAVAINANSTTKNQTIAAIGDPDVIIRYVNGTTGAKWQVVWYGNVEQNAANVTATNQTRLTHVFVTRNGSNITIYENTTEGETMNISVDRWDGTLSEGQNLNGTLDETRTWNVILSSTQRSGLVNDPNGPVPEGRQARYMYDRGSGGQVLEVIGGSEAAVSNASWVAGFAGKTLQPADLLGNGDYRWRIEGPEIKPVSGGELDSAPVAWVEYDRSGMTATALDKMADAFSLANLIVLALIASLLITATRFRQ